MNNTALHLKYRPKTLDEFHGNEAVVDSLKMVLEREEDSSGVVRSFMFIGPTGCGKTTLARIVKNELSISDRDYQEINASDMRGIDSVRDIIKNCRYKPLEGKNKMYVLDEFHQMTKAAQNAFLKLLEEPPKHVRIALCTTDPQMIIKTIKNRCTCFSVKNLDSRSIIGLCKSICDKEGAEDFPLSGYKQIAKYSQGSPRKALVILDKVIDILDEDKLLKAIDEETSLEEGSIDLCRAIIGGDWKQAKKVLKGLDRNSLEPESVRYAVCGYMEKVLLNNGGQREAEILLLFAEDNFYDGKWSMLCATTFMACNI